MGELNTAILVVKITESVQHLSEHLKALTVRKTATGASDGTKFQSHVVQRKKKEQSCVKF